MPVVTRSQAKAIKDQPSSSSSHQPPHQTATLMDREPNERNVARGRPVGDYITPTLGGYGSPIKAPDDEAYHFEIKTGLIHMITSHPFTGIGNPNTHLATFTELCDTYKINGVRREWVYLKLFPFSLIGKAKEWFVSHEQETFESWEDLAKAFLVQYFPPAKTKRLRTQITSFRQDNGESFYEAYERFKGLLRECPHHNFDKWELLQAFYDGMDDESRDRLDHASGGAIMSLVADEAFQVVERTAQMTHLYRSERISRGKAQVNYADYVTKGDLKDVVKDAFKEMTLHMQGTSEGPKVARVCGVCSSTMHMDNSCPHNFPREEEEYEDANYMGRGLERGNALQMSNTYNPNYRNHPNLSYKNQDHFNNRNAGSSGFPPRNQNQGQGVYQIPQNKYQQKGNYQSGEGYQRNQHQDQGNSSNSQGYQQRNYQRDNQPRHGNQEESSRVDKLAEQVEQMIASQKMIFAQLAQMAQDRAPNQNQGKLPSQPDAHPSEHINAITLKSGRVLDPPQAKPRVTKMHIDVGEEETRGKDDEGNGDQEVMEEAPPKAKEPAPYVPKVPFPQRLKKRNQDSHFAKFAEMLKKLYVNLPLTEVITQMPYAKFLKIGGKSMK